jgi:pheromone a factor receptor
MELLHLRLTQYLVLTWYRFWKVDKTTRAARNHTSSSMHARHQRIRRKIFFMCTSILIPFLPMQLFWLYYNISLGLGSLKPYNFAKIHDPATFNKITFTTSQGVSSLEINGNYMPIVTVVPIFLWFGFTKEAVNIYRVYCLRLGLGKYFPKLYEEYEPDRTTTGSTIKSWGQNISGFFKAPGRGGNGNGGSVQ